MQVNIYGLSDRDALEELGQPSGHVWSLNDYYQFHSWLKVDRIFNLHHFPHINAEPGRFTGNWKDEYNKSGAIVHTLGDIEGVDRCTPIPESAIIDFAGGKKYLRCSISTMIYMAAWADYRFITIRGVALNRSEYRDQAWGILQAIDKCRRLGVKCSVWPVGRETQWRDRIEAFQPSAMQDIELTYWEYQMKTKLRLTPDQMGDHSC